MSQFYSLPIASVAQPIRDSVVVTFAVPEELAERFRFTQGQHLVLRAQIDGAEVRRSYSICSAVGDSVLRVAIKRTAGGVFSGWANEHLKAGALIEAMAPSGHFHVPLDADARRHYLAFAAGSGITPILSIIKTTLATEPHSRFTLVYGNRASSSVLFKDELSDLKDRYLERLDITWVMSREQQDIELFNGRITGEKCAQLLAQWIDVGAIDTAFICGPQDMMLGVSDALQQAGMDRNSIKFELFGTGARAGTRPAASAQRAAHRETAVTVILDGYRSSFTMEQDKESILDAGLRQGLELRYSCKAGVCSTCRCKLVEGRVEMDANYALEDYEVARGFVLSCQSFPVTDAIVLDFDQAE